MRGLFPGICNVLSATCIDGTDFRHFIIVLCHSHSSPTCSYSRFPNQLLTSVCPGSFCMKKAYHILVCFTTVFLSYL